MTVRKIIEQVDLLKRYIGKDNYLTYIQDYLVTIQNNSTNLVLLKDILDKAILDYENLEELGIPEILNKILVNDEEPFTQNNFHSKLIELRKKENADPNTLYSFLSSLLTEIQTNINQNIVELDKISETVRPFLSKDYSEIQDSDNVIFAIIFNNEASYNNLKNLSFELKNWNRSLFIYQQLISIETPKAFEIIEIDQGSIEVVINLLFEVGEKLLELFKTGLEVYAAYLSYKTIVHDQLVNTYKGNKRLLDMEEERENLLLENVRIAVKEELENQTKKTKNKEAIEKKIEEVTKLVTEHIIKGNNVKLLSVPEEKEEAKEQEAEKEKIFAQNKINYMKLDEKTKALLIEQFTTHIPIESYENE